MPLPNQPYFEPIAHDPNCDFCAGRRTPAVLDVDAAYCISLVEQPHRTAYATAHFHETGLCRQVTFFRPHRPKSDAGRAIWKSHRAVAREALSSGHRRVLIMEDDVSFRRPIADIARRVERALSAMPADWWGLYLGHVPIQCYPVARGLLRARSVGLHAYIANTPLLDWFDKAPPRSIAVPMWPPIAPSVDSATSLLPKMYALFPIMALQKDLKDNRINPLVTSQGQRRRWSDVDRWRHLFLFQGALVAEAFAALGSPFHWLTMDYFIRRIERRAADAIRIREAGLFDDAYYLKRYPDIELAEVDPVTHYFEFGAREGRWPSAFFDPQFYARHASTLRPGENPLLHYLAVGRDLNIPTHPDMSEVAEKTGDC